MEYLSKECYENLVEEIRQLETVEYPKVRDALTEAREKGDLSENFEYHAAKRELGRLMSKIRFKRRVLQFSQVLDTTRLSNDKAVLLSKVKIENLNTNKTMTYTLVNKHEANLQEKKISIKSPIGEALLGKKVGETVEVNVPAGLLRLKILEIEI